jgi:hypothetical protein
MRLKSSGGAARSCTLRAAYAGLVCALVLFSTTAARTAEAPSVTPPTMDNAVSSQGWLQQIVIKLENEASEDIEMLPATPGALALEWRSFDREGSALGALVNVGWVALAACLALLAQRLFRHVLSIRVRRLLRLRPDSVTLGTLLRLLLCDVGGLAVFSGAFIYSRHWLVAAGVGGALIIFSVNVLIRWRVCALIIGIVLRPGEPAARLIDLPDPKARRLAGFLSATILVVITLIGFARYYALMDEDSGASHVVGLLAAIIVCGLYVTIVFRARRAFEALIRGSAAGTMSRRCAPRSPAPGSRSAGPPSPPCSCSSCSDCPWDCCPTITA